MARTAECGSGLGEGRGDERGPLPSHLLTNGIFSSEMDQAKVEATFGRPAYLGGAGSLEWLSVLRRTHDIHDTRLVPPKMGPGGSRRRAAARRAAALHCCMG